MISRKLKNCTRTLVVAAALISIASLAGLGKSHVVHATVADPITQPSTFCTVVLQGEWKTGPNYDPNGECYSGTNCQVQEQNGIPHKTGCDTSTSGQLKGQSMSGVVALLSASQGLPSGANERIASYSPNTFDSENDGSGSRALDNWLERIINLLSALVGIVVVISLIIAGYMYMTARDNASQVAAAKQRILMAVVSLILFAFAYVLLQWLIPGGIF